MSPTITAARPRRTTATHSIPAPADLAAAREDVLAAVAEGQAGHPAGVTNALLAELTPDLAFDQRVAAVVALREHGLLDRTGLHLRLTSAGRAACLTQWSDSPTTRPHTSNDITEDLTMTLTARTLTARDAEQLVDQFRALNQASPELAREITGTFGRQWKVVDEALTSPVTLDQRTAMQIDCMTDGIRSRMADARIAA